MAIELSTKEHRLINLNFVIPHGVEVMLRELIEKESFEKYFEVAEDYFEDKMEYGHYAVLTDKLDLYFGYIDSVGKDLAFEFRNKVYLEKKIS